ncbi:Long chain acyl-CoA synthetase 8 [Thelohanellus kitauei]|uniref:long-chain-fatty-acid--CoA ligase n=1 Tax=Thelohanellus kitauei TaxID=669202 RepID=A0A0C2ME82_THEKT|nr:Long chain acyl-CoA synthetase 8 [Thelohanellus kitauei]
MDDPKPLILIESPRWYERIIYVAVKCIGYGLGSFTLVPHFLRYGFRPSDRSFKINTSHYLEGGSTVYRCKDRSAGPDFVDGIVNINQLIRRAGQLYSDKACIGRRPLLDKVTEICPQTQRELVKYKFGDFIWKDFKTVIGEIDRLGKRLLELGFNDENKLALFCNTSPDWLVVAFSLVWISSPFVTLYSTLSDDSVVHALNITEVVGVVVDERTLPRIQGLLGRVRHIKYIIVATYIEKVQPIECANLAGVQYFILQELIDHDTLANIPPKTIDPDSLAFIMFTSGSTGIPKGVMISHKNIITQFGLIKFIRSQVSEKLSNMAHIYAAYLPSSHIFECVFEFSMFGSGYSIGFCTPWTLFDESPMLIKGNNGDLTALRPTVVITVPLLLDRIKRAVISKLRRQRRLKQLVFQCSYSMKMKYRQYGIETPLIDRFVFRSVSRIFGGYLEIGLIGGASVSRDLEEFANICLGTFKQGYGLTETTSAVLMIDYNYMRTGSCGSPFPHSEIKLGHWLDGENIGHDCPTGEIMISGDCLALGYYKNQELTDVSFVKDATTGKRWFYTGDIGMVLPDLTIRVIDRRKDIIKLSHGEYISLVRIENIISDCNLVEFVCVLPDDSMKCLIALIVPQRQNTKEFLDKELHQSCQDIESLLKIPEICDAISKNIKSRVIKT